MRRAFQETEEEETRGPSRWGGRAFTDDALGRRFGGGGEEQAGELMDEAAVKRLLAEERRKAAEAAPPAAERRRGPRRGSRSRSRSREAPLLVEVDPPAAAAEPFPPLPPLGQGLPVTFGPGETLPSGQAEGSGGRVVLRPGQLARLVGLRAAAHLNGEKGLLERFDEEAGRWEVRLGDGEAKAIKPENLEPLPPSEQRAEPAAGHFPTVAPQSPEERSDVAPRTPPQSHPGGGNVARAAHPPRQSGALAGVAGLSSAALAGSGHVVSKTSSSSSSHKTSRRLGTVRWYNGRRKLGYIIPDGAEGDLFIPAQGAVNGCQVPPQPGGLFHGTRVTYMPMAISKGDVMVPQSAPAGAGRVTETVCMDVRPLGGQVGLSVGVDTNAGAKEVNDDRVAATDINELGFFAAVLDGHRGHACAEYVAQQLPSAVLTAYKARAKKEGSLVKVSTDREAQLIANSLSDAFEAVDRAFMVTARKKEMKDGSTGIAILVSHGFEAPKKIDTSAMGCAALWPKPKEPSTPEKRPGTVPRAPGGVAKLFVAWCGDCRGVLLRGRQGLRITEDHRPARPDETKRIKAAGGTVVQDAHGVWRCGPRADNKFVKELQKGRKPDASKLKWFLSACRGFGDFELKVPDPIVISTPEVKVVDLVPEDWAVVVASDGIFDVLSDQEVADTLWRSMAGQGRDPVRAARDVVQAALRGGSRDNLTAVVMRLGWAPPPALDAALTTAPAAAPAEEAGDSLNMFG